MGILVVVDFKRTDIKLVIRPLVYALLYNVDDSSLPEELKFPQHVHAHAGPCDNILSGYLCVVNTVFSQQDGIYDFKFLTRFFGDLLQRSHFFVSLNSFLNLII